MFLISIFHSLTVYCLWIEWYVCCGCTAYARAKKLRWSIWFWLFLNALVGYEIVYLIFETRFISWFSKLNKHKYLFLFLEGAFLRILEFKFTLKKLLHNSSYYMSLIIFLLNMSMFVISLYIICNWDFSFT